MCRNGLILDEKRVMYIKKIVLVFIILLVTDLLNGADRIFFKYVKGLPCAEVELASERESLKANMVIDIGVNYTVLLAEGTTDILQASSDRKININYEGGSFTSIEYSEVDLSAFDGFTRDNAAELDDIPIFGILGARAFNTDKLSLNLADGYIDFGSDILWPEVEATAVDVNNYVFRLNIEPDPGYVISAELSTSAFQTVFDEDCAALAGNEYGIFDKCLIGGYDLNQYTAVQTIQSGDSGLGGADAVIANSFWQNFKVYIDIKNENLYIEDKGRVISDLSEQYYFNACIDEDFEGVLDYINNFPDSRVRTESCWKLLELATENKDSGRMTTALECIVTSGSFDTLSGSLLSLAKSNIGNGEIETAKVLLEFVRKGEVKDDNNPFMIAEVNTMAGEIALLENDLVSARRFLLSSLFVRPKDANCNYLMGEYYRKSGMLMRAWSRYIKAALVDEPSQEALRELLLLQNDTGFEENISLTDTTDFLEGYIYDDDGDLTDQAKILKHHGGEHMKAAFTALEVQSASN